MKALVFALVLATASPAYAWHPWKTTVVPLEQVQETKKPERVIEIRPTRDPVTSTGTARQLGNAIWKNAVVSLSVTAVVTVAKIVLLGGL